MNQYGAMALRHWRAWLPTRFAQIGDPQEFFSTLGEQVANQIDETSRALAGPDLTDEDYLGKVGRLAVARKQAEEIVLAELVLLEPETGGGGSVADRDSLAELLADLPDWWTISRSIDALEAQREAEGLLPEQETELAILQTIAPWLEPFAIGSQSVIDTISNEKVRATILALRPYYHQGEHRMKTIDEIAR